MKNWASPWRGMVAQNGFNCRFIKILTPPTPPPHTHPTHPPKKKKLYTKCIRLDCSKDCTTLAGFILAGYQIGFRCGKAIPVDSQGDRETGNPSRFCQDTTIFLSKFTQKYSCSQIKKNSVLCLALTLIPFTARLICWLG